MGKAVREVCTHGELGYCDYCAREEITPRDDFRAHTCGECAWAGRNFIIEDIVTANEFANVDCVYCRRVPWGTTKTAVRVDDDNDPVIRRCLSETAQGIVSIHTPACPAYVPREAQP